MKNLKRITAAFVLAILFSMPLMSKAQSSVKPSKETAETIDVVGTAITRTIEATGNENIKIEGSSMNITVTGNCNSILVTGAGIKVKAQGVKVIKINGAASGVTYKFSPNKNGKAISSVSGAGSYVTKLK